MTPVVRFVSFTCLTLLALFGLLQLSPAGGPAGASQTRPLADGKDANPTLPLADGNYVLGNDIAEYAAFLMSGGPPPDGIPSIDKPAFVDAADAKLDAGDPVIGFSHGGDARAYPQRIVVYHEIVNDRVGDLNLAVTYCPLTATAQGFKRGDTTLGVSGKLLNSNLVMFDRSTKSYFSQISATGLTGPHRGRTLDEVRLVWTTWGHWRAVHPHTRVLSDRTGHLRNYNRDPYGRYNPLGGYYAEKRTMFPLMHRSDRRHQKEMVIGARTATRSVYFVMSELARDQVQSTPNFLAVYDPRLDTGYIYLRGREVQVVPRGEGMYEFQGNSHRADALPLTQVLAVEAFHFAWHAFYPKSESP